MCAISAGRLEASEINVSRTEAASSEGRDMVGGDFIRVEGSMEGVACSELEGG